MYGSCYSNCASCWKRGDRILKRNFMTLTKTYLPDLPSLNRSIRKTTRQEIVVGKYTLNNNYTITNLKEIVYFKGNKICRKCFQYTINRKKRSKITIG